MKYEFSHKSGHTRTKSNKLWKTNFRTNLVTLVPKKLQIMKDEFSHKSGHTRPKKVTIYESYLSTITNCNLIYSENGEGGRWEEEEKEEKCFSTFL